MRQYSEAVARKQLDSKLQNERNDKETFLQLAQVERELTAVEVGDRRVTSLAAHNVPVHVHRLLLTRLCLLPLWTSAPVAPHCLLAVYPYSFASSSPASLSSA